MPLHTRLRAVTRGAALVCAVALVLVGGASASLAAEAPPAEHPTDHPDPVAYRSLAIEVSRNTARIAQMGTQIDDASARVTGLDGQIVALQQQLDAARAEAARLKGVVRARAAFIYTHARAPQHILDIPHVEDIASGTQYAQSASVSDAARAAS